MSVDKNDPLPQLKGFAIREARRYFGTDCRIDLVLDTRTFTHRVRVHHRPSYRFVEEMLDMGVSHGFDLSVLLSRCYETMQQILFRDLAIHGFSIDPMTPDLGKRTPALDPCGGVPELLELLGVQFSARMRPQTGSWSYWIAKPGEWAYEATERWCDASLGEWQRWLAVHIDSKESAL